MVLLMQYVFKCPCCSYLIKSSVPDRCEKCGYTIKDSNGIYIFTPKGNLEINAENKYVGFDVIAPYYDTSRERSFDSEEGAAVGRLLGSGKTVLEIGAGTGYHSIPMSKAGCNIIAGDISIEMLKILVHKIGNDLMGKLIPCKMDAYSLPLVDASVDAVFIDHVFHLIEKPEIVLHEVKRVLKPDGCFINILYTGEILSTEEEVKAYQEITMKIDELYEKAVKKNGLKLLERFGWIGQQTQQVNLNKFFSNYRVIKDEAFVKKQRSTIRNVINDYRNLSLVAQAEIDREINRKILDEIEEHLTEEYGKNILARKLDTIERTAIQIFTIFSEKQMFQ